MQAPLKVDIVVPIYDESECIPELASRLDALEQKMLPEVRLEFVFVNDGSRDDSLRQLMDFANNHGNTKVVNLSRNFGHQLAITAGIDFATGDYTLIIDGDLQDPPELLKPMLDLALSEKADVVYGLRINRKGETLFKRVTAALFYRLLRSTANVEIPANTGDFRLISRKVAQSLREMREQHRFIRGFVAWVGFKNIPYHYERDARFDGVTKYPFRKMLRLSIDAMLSFSHMPLRLASIFGLIVITLGLLGLSYMIYLKIFTDKAVPGITVILTSIMMVGGTQILMLGIISEYLGRIFEETKKRPLYIVESVYQGEEQV